MGLFSWLNRLAGKADEKIEPAAVAMSGRTAPVASEIRKEGQAEEIEKP